MLSLLIQEQKVVDMREKRNHDAMLLLSEGRA